MKKKLAVFLEKAAPGLLLRYRAINNRRMFKRKYEQLQKEVKDKFFNEAEIKVFSGPFTGLKYIDKIVWGSITPKWLGSYESELHEIMEKIIATGYEVIIDVGCAEGYYAAGLAYRSPSSMVYAFDTDFISRKQLHQLAILNNLSKRIIIGKFCNFTDINKLYRNKTLCVSDIEGYEKHLLDPGKCETLKKVDILVEVHEANEFAGNADLIYQRFQPTHEITRIDCTDRNKWIEDFCSQSTFQKFDKNLLQAATDESRSDGLLWYWMKSKNMIA